MKERERGERNRGEWRHVADRKDQVDDVTKRTGQRKGMKGDGRGEERGEDGGVSDRDRGRERK